jgi:hypothetical protein
MDDRMKLSDVMRYTFEAAQDPNDPITPENPHLPEIDPNPYPVTDPIPEPEPSPVPQPQPIPGPPEPIPEFPPDVVF